jgi:hypothetical protein
VRFAYFPRHISKAKPNEVKPSFFSQADTVGCSVQRESLSSDDVLKSIVHAAEETKQQEWRGVLQAEISTIRRIKLFGFKGRAVCIYDTAMHDNIGHADIFHSERVIEEADRVEVRKHLMDAFNGGKFVTPKQYRGGALLG